MCRFFMVDGNFEFGIVMCASPEVTLLSEELLYIRMVSSTLSSLKPPQILRPIHIGSHCVVKGHQDYNGAPMNHAFSLIVCSTYN